MTHGLICFDTFSSTEKEHFLFEKEVKYFWGLWALQLVGRPGLSDLRTAFKGARVQTSILGGRATSSFRAGPAVPGEDLLLPGTWELRPGRGLWADLKAPVPNTARAGGFSHGEI